MKPIKGTVALVLWSLCLLPYHLEAKDNADYSTSSVRGSNKERQLQEVGEVYGFVLINSLTDKPIAKLYEGMVINLHNFGLSSAAFNIEALVSGAPVESVKFGLDADPNFKTENVSPYTACGNSGTYFYKCPELGLGQHTITATPFSENSAGGNAGSPYTVNFSIVVEGSPAITEGITKLELYYAPSNQYLMDLDLTGETVVNVAELGLATVDFNINAVNSGNLVQSVAFSPSGRKESTEPFSYCGNIGPSYNSCPDLNVGVHTITVTPYPFKQQRGTPFDDIVATIRIIDDPAIPVPAPVAFSVPPPQPPTVSVASSSPSGSISTPSTLPVGIPSSWTVTGPTEGPSESLSEFPASHPSSSPAPSSLHTDTLSSSPSSDGASESATPAPSSLASLTPSLSPSALSLAPSSLPSIASSTLQVPSSDGATQAPTSPTSLAPSLLRSTGSLTPSFLHTNTPSQMPSSDGASESATQVPRSTPSLAPSLLPSTWSSAPSSLPSETLSPLPNSDGAGESPTQAPSSSAGSDPNSLPTIWSTSPSSLPSNSPSSLPGFATRSPSFSVSSAPSLLPGTWSLPPSSLRSRTSSLSPSSDDASESTTQTPNSSPITPNTLSSAPNSLPSGAPSTSIGASESVTEAPSTSSSVPVALRSTAPSSLLNGNTEAPAPVPTGVSISTEGITRLELYYAPTNKYLMDLDLTGETVVNVRELGLASADFNINAVKTGSVVQSVAFSPSGHHESFLPFMYCGNTGKSYNSCPDLKDGVHTITVTPYPLAQQQGTPLDDITATIHIIDDMTSAPTNSPIIMPLACGTPKVRIFC